VKGTLSGMMVCEEYRPFALRRSCMALFPDKPLPGSSAGCFLCTLRAVQSVQRDTATGGSNNKKRRPRVGVNQVSRCGIARGL
jgi:hypothetical protein